MARFGPGQGRRTFFDRRKTEIQIATAMARMGLKSIRKVIPDIDPPDNDNVILAYSTGIAKGQRTQPRATGPFRLDAHNKSGALF